MVECNNAMAAMYGFASGEELRGRRMSERVLPEDPRNIEMAREFIRSGFRLLEHESHEVDRYGNPKICMNSMIGTVEDGRLVRIWGIRRDITEKVKLEESRRRAEEALHENVAQLQEVTEELRLAKEKLSEEKLYLEQTIDTELGFGEIIGRSSALKEVMQKVAKVAPSDATVLLLGETGTGKELVARAIHRMSRREGNSFIKLNCAAIPSGLLESELFGHEKGAFTGAVARKLGRLELADRGTLFLDEVGEIPLSLQPKLLRVLQDLEFERLGGTQTLKVNFRLLAATNRDLLQSVEGTRISQRLVLPAECVSHPHSAFAREARRHPAADRTLRPQVCRADEEIDHQHSLKDHGDDGAVGLAGQHSRAGEFCGAFGDSDAGIGSAGAARGTANRG